MLYCKPDGIGGFGHQVAGFYIHHLVELARYVKAKRFNAFGILFVKILFPGFIAECKFEFVSVKGLLFRANDRQKFFRYYFSDAFQRISNLLLFKRYL